ncbi:MAG: hypothetical protein HC835_11595 [Oscillatoriales cyanobacterium RM2_1_1]|nr:hypothetical protein [Oscillatoriales cyanobacterium SM2_3_0]NJO46218.1 hypothetical protein [Oscillatoriales cyanobacterium RM2_1_1]
MLDGETLQSEFECEFEGEYEGEFEGEYEDEYEAEEFLGNVFKGVGGALGLFEGEGESEYESEYESEAFLKKLRGFARKLTPILKQIAPKAAQFVGTAIGGPGVGSTLGNVASSLTREGEFEYEFEGEYEFEFEGEYEDEYEAEVRPEAFAEALAAMAAQTPSEGEAEAYSGAFTARIIPVKSPAIRRNVPHIMKGSRVLTKTLRSNPKTRVLVPMVPTIVARTSKQLAKQAAAGKPVNRKTTAKVMAQETKKALSKPMTCAKTIMRANKTARTAVKPAPARTRV